MRDSDARPLLPPSETAPSQLIASCLAAIHPPGHALTPPAPPPLPACAAAAGMSASFFTVSLPMCSSLLTGSSMHGISTYGMCPYVRTTCSRKLRKHVPKQGLLLNQHLSVTLPPSISHSPLFNAAKKQTKPPCPRCVCGVWPQQSLQKRQGAQRCPAGAEHAGARRPAAERPRPVAARHLTRPHLSWR
jgi:hypothetical protein